MHGSYYFGTVCIYPSIHRTHDNTHTLTHMQHFVSCLTWACGRGYSPIVESLLSNGAKVNTADKVMSLPCDTFIVECLSLNILAL